MLPRTGNTLIVPGAVLRFCKPSAVPRRRPTTIESRKTLLIILVSRLLDLLLIVRIQRFLVTFRGLQRNVELGQPFREIGLWRARQCVRHTSRIVQALDDRA